MGGMDNEYAYMDADDDMVEYLTAQIDGSFARQEASYEKTREGAEKLLNMLVAGIGAAGMLLFSIANSNGAIWVLGGLGITASGWFVCAAYLLKKCIVAQPRPTPFSKPSALYFDDARTNKKVTLPSLKRFRIYDKETYINDLAEINRARVKALDFARYGAAACPLIGIVCAALFAWFLLLN